MSLEEVLTSTEYNNGTAPLLLYGEMQMQTQLRNLFAIDSEKLFHKLSIRKKVEWSSVTASDPQITVQNPLSLHWNEMKLSWQSFEVTIIGKKLIAFL